MIYFKFNAFLTLLAFYICFLCQLFALSLLLSSNFYIKLLFPHPTSDERSPKLQNFLKLVNFTHFNASGITSLFFVSYGAGTPSNTFNLSVLSLLNTHCYCTFRCFMWNHSSYSSPEHSWWSSIMDKGSSWISQKSFS